MKHFENVGMALVLIVIGFVGYCFWDMQKECESKGGIYVRTTGYECIKAERVK